MPSDESISMGRWSKAANGVGVMSTRSTGIFLPPPVELSRPLASGRASPLGSYGDSDKTLGHPMNLSTLEQLECCGQEIANGPGWGSSGLCRSGIGVISLTTR